MLVVQFVFSIIFSSCIIQVLAAITSTSCGEPSRALLKYSQKVVWPYIASVGVDIYYTKRKGTWRGGNCDAVLLNQEWAITNSHCLRTVYHLYNRNPNKHRWTVRTGQYTNKKLTPKVFRKARAIKKIFRQLNSPFSEMALVQMKQQLPYTKGIQPICLPIEESDASASRCHVLGYRDLSSPPVVVQNCSTCREKYSDSFNCAEKVCGQLRDQLFQGINGGVLVCHDQRGDFYTWYVAGIGLERSNGTVFQRVDSVVNWINKITLENSRYKVKFARI